LTNFEPFNKFESPHCRVAALPCQSVAALLRCRIAALPRRLVNPLPRCPVAALLRCRVAPSPRHSIAASLRCRVAPLPRRSVAASRRYFCTFFSSNQQFFLWLNIDKAITVTSFVYKTNIDFFYS
jgi:hypothetical protein